MTLISLTGWRGLDNENSLATVELCDLEWLLTNLPSANRGCPWLCVEGCTDTIVEIIKQVRYVPHLPETRALRAKQRTGSYLGMDYAYFVLTSQRVIKDSDTGGSLKVEKPVHQEDDDEEACLQGKDELDRPGFKLVSENVFVIFFYKENFVLSLFESTGNHIYNGFFRPGNFHPKSWDNENAAIVIFYIFDVINKRSDDIVAQYRQLESRQHDAAAESSLLGLSSDYRIFCKDISVISDLILRQKHVAMSLYEWQKPQKQSGAFFSRSIISHFDILERSLDSIQKRAKDSFELNMSIKLFSRKGLR